MTGQHALAVGEHLWSGVDDDEPHPTDTEIAEALLLPHNGSTVIEEITRLLGDLVEHCARRRDPR